MQPVIILINRLIDKTEGRSLSKSGTTYQHHIKGWASFPLALYTDMTRISYCSSNSGKNNRRSIFHIEIFVSGKIEYNLLYPIREGIQRKTCFRNAFYFRTKHVGQMNGVKHSHVFLRIPVFITFTRVAEIAVVSQLFQILFFDVQFLHQRLVVI